VRREIEERRIDLMLDFAPDLPQLTGDRVQLQQVVVNLVQNACDAMRSFPPPRRLAIASRAAGSQVELTVSDSGPGVPPSVAAAIFEPYVSTKSGGMGMGLSICRSLVESHGGTLTHESPAEGGARFRVSLPIAAAAAEAT
jgi:signal transduction histidine kinase